MQSSMSELLKLTNNIQMLMSFLIIFISMIIVTLMFQPLLKIMLLAKIYIK